MPRAGGPPVIPIYTQADAIASLESFRPVEYETWVEVIPGVRARYWNAGHLLGSASIELEFAGEGASGQPLRFWRPAISAPTRNCCNPIRKRPAGFDYVISESTYGDRIRATDHRHDSAAQRLAAEVDDAAAARAPCSSQPSRSNAPRN